MTEFGASILVGCAAGILAQLTIISVRFGQIKNILEDLLKVAEPPLNQEKR